MKDPFNLYQRIRRTSDQFLRRKRRASAEEGKTCTIKEEVEERPSQIQNGQGGADVFRLSEAIPADATKENAEDGNGGDDGNVEKLLTKKQMREVRELFSLFDLNGDGSINKKELTIVMKSLGGHPTDEMVNKIMVDYDDDGNEIIDFDEFMKMIIKYNQDLQNDPVKELRNALGVFDKEKTGNFDRDTVSRMLSLGAEPVDGAEIEQFLNFMKISETTATQTDTLINTFLTPVKAK